MQFPSPRHAGPWGHWAWGPGTATAPALPTPPQRPSLGPALERNHGQKWVAGSRPPDGARCRWGAPSHQAGLMVLPPEIGHPSDRRNAPAARPAVRPVTVRPTHALLARTPGGSGAPRAPTTTSTTPGVGRSGARQAPPGCTARSGKHGAGRAHATCVIISTRHALPGARIIGARWMPSRRRRSRGRRSPASLPPRSQSALFKNAPPSVVDGRKLVGNTANTPFRPHTRTHARTHRRNAATWISTVRDRKCVSDT